MLHSSTFWLDCSRVLPGCISGAGMFGIRSPEGSTSLAWWHKHQGPFRFRDRGVDPCRPGGSRRCGVPLFRSCVLPVPSDSAGGWLALCPPVPYMSADWRWFGASPPLCGPPIGGGVRLLTVLAESAVSAIGGRSVVFRCFPLSLPVDQSSRSVAGCSIGAAIRSSVLLPLCPASGSVARCLIEV